MGLSSNANGGLAWTNARAPGPRPRARGKQATGAPVTPTDLNSRGLAASQEVQAKPGEAPAPAACEGWVSGVESESITRANLQTGWFRACKPASYNAFGLVLLLHFCPSTSRYASKLRGEPHSEEPRCCAAESSSP